MIQVTSKSPFERWLQYLGFPLALAVYGIIYSVPTPEALTVRGKLSLAVFFMALVLWVSEAIPTYATALLAIVMLALTGAWDEKSILGVFGYDVIWLMVAAFIITSGMVKTGVARRLALWLVATFGGTARRVLLIMIITNFILAFIVPSTTARAALILPIVVLLAQTYGAIPGKSNFGRALMIQELQVNNISTSAVLTATAPQIMAVGLIKDLTGQSVSWTSWLVASLPVALGTMIVSYLIGLLLFPPEVNTPKGEGIRKLKEELAALGRVTADEWKALAIFGLTIFLWATGPHHMAMFGFSISLVMVAIIAATLLYMPFIGLITWKETQIPWDLMIFSAGAYAVGLSIEKSGAASWALNEIFSAFNVTSIPFLVLFAVVMFIASFSHMVFTSKTVRTVILIPAIIGLAKATGYNPIALALPAAFTIADSITLPPNCKPNLIFYSTGQFTVLNQLWYGILVLVGKWLLLILAALTWFKFLDIA